jgi:hypothetical protein
MTARLLIRQENGDLGFPPISANSAEMDGAPVALLKNNCRSFTAFRMTGHWILE